MLQTVMDLLCCGQCQQTFSLSENEAGTQWLLAAQCPHCGTLHHFDSGPDDSLDNMIDSAYGIHFPEDGSITLRSEPVGTVRERVQNLAVHEYWVQLYVKAKYRKLGFSKIEGPFNVGPDFCVTKGGRATYAEVEVRCKNYLQHRHHTDSRFEKVSILIVLEQDEPSSKDKKLLPKTLIHLDQQDFTKWFRKSAKKYATEKQKERLARSIRAKVMSLGEEFHSRWVEVCPDRERDMATCPYCDLCPYFGEGTSYEASEHFQTMALEFLSQRKMMETRKLVDIAPDEIDQFFQHAVGLRE